MKKAGVCPKCKGADIVRVPGGIRSTMDSTQNFVTCGFRSAPVDRYICCGCGFSEEWLREDDLEKIENIGRKRPNERIFMELTSKQRAQLRGLANTIDTIIHVGKDGIGENLIKQADDALEARELIKGRVLENNIEYDARLAAQELAAATRSEVVQVIGTKFVLYRESHSKPREKRIQLVKPAKKRANA